MTPRHDTVSGRRHIPVAFLGVARDLGRVPILSHLLQACLPPPRQEQVVSHSGASTATGPCLRTPVGALGGIPDSRWNDDSSASQGRVLDVGRARVHAARASLGSPSLAMRHPAPLTSPGTSGTRCASHHPGMTRAGPGYFFGSAAAASLSRTASRV